MKKFWKYIAIATLTVVMAPLTACDDDSDLGLKDKADYVSNFVYFDTPTSTFASVEYKANGDFLSGLTDPLKLVPIRLTKPAASNLQVEVAIDETLVDEYNEANGTDYTFLTGAVIDNPMMNIPAGKFMSADTISISFGDHSGFMNQENDLILPIVVKGGAGLTPSKSARVFLTFNSTYCPNYLSIPQSNLLVNIGIEDEGWEETAETIYPGNIVSLTYDPYEEVTVNVAIDESMVAAYNEANGTDYEFKADAELVSSALKIGTDGQLEPLAIKTGDLTGIGNKNSYLIPVTITSVEGAAVEMAEGEKTVYVIVRGATRELSVVNSVTGPMIDQPVACTVDGSPTSPSGKQWIKVIDYSTWDYANIPKNAVMEIDFGKVVNLSSFYVYHYGSYYSSSALTLQTSADGVKWNDWGEVEYSKRPKLYVNLSAPEALRYMRLKFTQGGTIEIDGMAFYGSN